jgi:hypothetical protein
MSQGGTRIFRRIRAVATQNAALEIAAATADQNPSSVTGLVLRETMALSPGDGSCKTSAGVHGAHELRAAGSAQAGTHGHA